MLKLSPRKKTARHFHFVETGMGNFHRYHLRLQSRNRSETDGLQFNLFAFKQTRSQVTERNGEPESGESPAGRDVDPVGDRFVVLADVRTCRPRQKIGGEFALRFSILEFLPRPFFLNQLRLLTEKRVLFKKSAIGKFVGDNNVKLIALNPLPKFSVSQFLAIDIA